MVYLYKLDKINFKILKVIIISDKIGLLVISLNEF